MLSVRASEASKYLIEDPCSLYIQSAVDRKRLQSDGWGIGFYKRKAPRLVKSDEPIYEEREKFGSAVQYASSRIVLAHIRRASNPRGLPKDKMISIENSQPFKHENYLFIHNGTITIPDEVAEALGEWKRKIESLNDSEVYFWHIVKELTDGKILPEALKDFEKVLSELWQKNREKHLGKRRPYVGLNAIFSDGEKLYAYCKYDKEDEAARSLCLKDQPVFQMSYLASSERLVVASEKTNREEGWKSLDIGQLLIGQIKRGRVSIDLQEITQDSQCSSRRVRQDPQFKR